MLALCDVDSLCGALVVCPLLAGLVSFGRTVWSSWFWLSSGSVMVLVAVTLVVFLFWSELVSLVGHRLCAYRGPYKSWPVLAIHFASLMFFVVVYVVISGVSLCPATRLTSGQLLVGSGPVTCDPAMKSLSPRHHQMTRRSLTRRMTCDL